MIEGRFHGTRARLSFTTTTKGLVPKVWCVLSFIVILHVCLHRHVCELLSQCAFGAFCVCVHALTLTVQTGSVKQTRGAVLRLFR
jgi:hypothetical protein